MTTKWTPETFATFADFDDTIPVPSPNEWRTDLALRQIEREMNDPAGFAAFCVAVLAVSVITDVATIILLRILGVANGLCRVRPCDTKTVLRMLEQLRPEIEATSNRPRRERLDSLWYHHAGMFFHDQGQYNLAAELLENSTTRAKANGDMQGWAIGRFCAAVERVNHALMTGKGIKKALQRLRGRASTDLDNHVPSTSNEYHWVCLNAPIHRILSHFWADDMTYRGLREDWSWLVGCLKRENSTLYEAHTRAIEVCDVLYEFSYHDGHDSPPRETKSSDTVEHKASIMLVNARLARNDDLCAVILQEIIDLPEDGAQQVQAVARRELALLES